MCVCVCVCVCVFVGVCVYICMHNGGLSLSLPLPPWCSLFSLSLSLSFCAGALRACFYGIRGDQKARRECHHFSRHYNCNLLCDRCLAMKPGKNCVDGMNYKDFSSAAPLLLTTVDHNMYLNTTPATRLSPWTAMPGWKIENTFL